ncbi:MAG: DUF3800 domain-containing protein [Candidatus Competibacteraceae bacterium]|nr:DUF3800 domain-containing protein [Candidatus Competibacteraceae bacterium]
MLVLIDESGDPGFKVSKGSSPVFVVAMVIFNDFLDAEHTSKSVSELRKKLRVKPEFKFNKSHNSIRDEFFKSLEHHKFTIRSLVVIKSRIHSAGLRDNTDRFYNFFVRMLLNHDNGMLNNARVKIDGSGDRRFKQELQAYLRRLLKERIASIKFADSRRDNLIQLADMAAGAIARSYNEDRKDADRWLKMLQNAGKIGDKWEFR